MKPKEAPTLKRKNTGKSTEKRNEKPTETVKSNRTKKKKEDDHPPDAHIILLGFNEKEFDDEVKKKTPGLIFYTGAKGLSDEINLVVLKENAAAKTFYEWAPAFYALLAGLNIVKPSWLKACFKAQKVVNVEDHVYTKEMLPFLPPISKGEKEPVITTEKFAKLALEFGKGKNNEEFFDDPVFRKVLVFAGNSRDEEKRKRELKVVLQAGGAELVGDGTWGRIQACPSTSTYHCNVVVFVFQNKEKRETLVKDKLIEKLLIERIPVLTEQLIYEMIISKEKPTKSSMLMLSFQNWTEKLRWNKQELFDWLTQPEDSPMPDILKEQITRRGTSKRALEHKVFKERHEVINMAHLPSNSVSDIMREDSTDIKKTLKRVKMGDTDDNDLTSEDLLAEFEAEICLNEERSQGPTPPGSPFMSPIPDAVFNLNESFERCDLGMTIHRFPLSVSELERFLEQESFEWKATVMSAEGRVREALQTRNLTTAEHPPELLARFDMLWGEFTRYLPKHRMHSIVANQLVDLVRCSIGPNFLPEPHVLSRLLHEIAMPRHGKDARLPEQIYLLLQAFLTMSPPCNTGLRYYWLQVLSASDCDVFGKDRHQKVTRKSDASQDAKEELIKRVHSFRKMIVDAFMDGSTDSALQSLLIDILEADLWSCELMGVKEKKSERDSKTQVLGYSTDLKFVPLAYLIFYEAGGRRMFDFNNEAKKMLFIFCDYLKTAENPSLRENAARILALSLEAVYWYGTNVFEHNELIIGGIPRSLRIDVQALGRRITNKGLTKGQVQELLPVKWIQECIYDDK